VIALEKQSPVGFRYANPLIVNQNLKIVRAECDIMLLSQRCFNFCNELMAFSSLDQYKP
jgi:hypothetical protein